jgi:hypothetical protein
MLKDTATELATKCDACPSGCNRAILDEVQHVTYSPYLCTYGRCHGAFSLTSHTHSFALQAALLVLYFLSSPTWDMAGSNCCCHLKISRGNSCFQAR